MAAILTGILAPWVVSAQGPSSEPSDLAAGEPLFARHCAACHGPDGEGGRGPGLAVPTLLAAPDDVSLVRVIRKGIEGTDMPASRLGADDVLRVAAWVRHLGQRPEETLPGDPARGRAVYYEKTGCDVCHAVNGRGGAYGPDLTDIGRRRGAAHLRTSLTDPEAEVPRSFSAYRSEGNLTTNFLQVRIVTREGRRLVGVRVNEDTFSIQFRDATGRLHSFYKSELAELSKDWGKTPMPAYAGVLSNEELDDLVAFLATLRDVR